MLPLPSRGRPGTLLMMKVVRELTHADIMRLATAGDDLPRSQVPTTQRLRASHHRAAQLLAQGKPVNEVAILVGRTPQRISDLKNKDPAFQNLMLYYETQFKELVIEREQQAQEIAADIYELAADEIRDRLEDGEHRKQIPVGELRQLAQTFGDRSVAPPKAATPLANAPPVITFNMGPRDIRQTAKVIDVEPEAETETKPETKVETQTQEVEP